ncbi:MAG: uroporphyrinogen-III synthase [Actinobacteria bacterium]|nr:uroporphyrinogen-III synthase [Actinomycetota bacterium]
MDFPAPPLEGLTIVVTRARKQARELIGLLELSGALVLEFPVIKTVEPEDWSSADAAIRDLATYEWVVFTSANSVKSFIARMELLGVRIESLTALRVAAVGTSTARHLASHGVAIDLLPDDFVAEGLIERFEKVGIGQGTRILLPRALHAREILPETLREWGATVDVVPVYRTVLGEGNHDTLASMEAGEVDVITFTSPSTVDNFLQLVASTGARDVLGKVAIAAIGPVTSEAIRAHGRAVDIEAAPHTVTGLVRAIARWAQQKKL